MGLEHKVVDTLSTELELPSNQLLALFNRSLKKIAGLLRSILEQQVQDKLDRVATNGVNVTPMVQLNAELDAGAAQEQERQQEKHRQALLSQDLMQYAVKGSDVEWNAALASKARPSTTLSIKTGEKRALDTEIQQEGDTTDVTDKKRKKKKDKHKKH